ncbi:MAG: CDP-glycerol glycerophosphotransferase family protein [Lachnospiraceae bacterium]|nr:CDP-glycerol glycerophosphotransferase family protein [Lachnospiraceae bacterium]MBO6208879.1 CDP-glycerol glycerophosphotransferase family protein [Lachnospiraceae bacterium]
MYLLYIDPGTGSMLFAALIGIFSTLLFFFQKLWIKFKFVLSGGRIKDKTSDEKLPYVIFSEGKSYWNVFKPVCEEFEKRGIDCEYYTADEKDPALEQGYEHVHCTFIGDGNKAFARLNMLNARVLLATTPGLEVYQWKRSRNVGKYVHIFHSLDEGTAYRMFGLDFYDSVLLVGDFQERYIRKLEELRGIPQKDLQVVGCTYMDGLLARRDKEGEAKPAEKQKTVLLAPSWGEISVLNRYKEKLIDALLATDYKVVIRPHPQSFKVEMDILQPLMDKYGDKVEWNRDADNFDILNRSDILISEFSSVVFDFAFVFDKPVLCFAGGQSDMAPYDAAWIDEEPWKQQVFPKLGKMITEEDFGSFQSLMDELVESTEYQKSRDDLREASWQNRRHSAEGIVDYLVETAARMQEEEDKQAADEKEDSNKKGNKEETR